MPGTKPQPPWTDELYRAAGAMLARFHALADTFNSAYPRDPVRTGNETSEVLNTLKADTARLHLVERVSEEAAKQLSVLTHRGLRWGICHGDPSLDNLHVTEATLHLYDFDLAGPGWQAEDLTGALSTSFSDAYWSGYTAVRSLPPVDQEALPWLRILAIIDNLHFHLITKPALQGTSSLAEGWVDAGFQSLVQTAGELGLAT